MFQHIPDDTRVYIHLYPPPHIAVLRPQAKRVRRYGIDGPQSGESDELRQLKSEGWTTFRWAKMVYSPDSTPGDVIAKTVYSPEQLAEALEDGWLEKLPTELHPHAQDIARQRFLKRQAERAATGKPEAPPSRHRKPQEVVGA